METVPCDSIFFFMDKKVIPPAREATFQALSELSASSAVASVSAAHGAACSDDTVIFLFRKGRDNTVGIEVVVILTGHGETAFVKIVGSVHTGLHIAHRSYQVLTPKAPSRERTAAIPSPRKLN